MKLKEYEERVLIIDMEQTALSFIEKIHSNCNECENLLNIVINEEIQKTKNLLLTHIVKNTMQKNMDIHIFKIYTSVNTAIKNALTLKKLNLDNNSLKYIEDNNINPALISAIKSREKIHELSLKISKDLTISSREKIQNFKKIYETESCKQAFAFNSATASLGQKIGYYLSIFFGPGKIFSQGKVSNWIENTFFSTHQKSIKRFQDTIDKDFKSQVGEILTK